MVRMQKTTEEKSICIVEFQARKAGWRNFSDEKKKELYETLAGLGLMVGADKVLTQGEYEEALKRSSDLKNNLKLLELSKLAYKD